MQRIYTIGFSDASKVLMLMPKNNNDYCGPLDLLNAVERENEQVSKEVFFNDPKYQKAQEKWCAAVFGIGFNEYCKKCRIRINESRHHTSPDFFLKIDDQVFEFEMTERQEPDRERGKYYKKLEQNPLMSMPYRPERGRQEGPSWIYEAIKKKVEKCYSDSRNLNILVYADFDTHIMDRKAILQKSGEFADKFASIWIITNQHICSLFSNDALGEIDSFREIKELRNRLFSRLGLCPAQTNSQ